MSQLFSSSIAGCASLWTQIFDDKRAIPRISVHTTGGNVSHRILLAENKQIAICIIDAE
jgi:hypothetical protein